MKAFVIGGAGFIGSHIVDELLHNQVDVVIIDNLSSGSRNWIHGNVTFYEMDMFDNDLDHVFAVERPDYVFHQAAQISVSQSMLAPSEDARMNILGTINVLQCAVKYGVKRFIFSSSAAVYGFPEQLPISESHNINPISFYGMSKAFAEQYIRMFSAQSNLKYSIFRYANVYGPRQNSLGEAGVIAIFLDHLITGKPLTIYGEGTQSRDFIHVKDIAAACIKSIGQKESFIMNLGTGNNISINELVAHIRNLTTTDVKTNKQPSRQGDISHSYLDNTAAREHLGWEPVYSIAEGLTDTYRFMQNELSRQPG